VQTLIETELVEFEGWVLRVLPSEIPKRLMLLIHGYTGDENSMWVFAQGLPSHYWIIAPRAPHSAESGGYTWRPLHRLDPSTSSGLRFGMPSLDQLRPPAEALIRLVGAYQASTGIDASVFDVMGFSQGAVMCNVLSFLFPQRIRKAAILAGFVPSGLEELIPQRPLEGKSFFVAHGTKDDTVTIDRARDSIRLLEEAGARVTYCEDEVGHKVSVKCLTALKNFFAN
jgi:phospholipase/carboxylesterase